MKQIMNNVSMTMPQTDIAASDRDPTAATDSPPPRSASAAETPEPPAMDMASCDRRFPGLLDSIGLLAGGGEGKIWGVAAGAGTTSLLARDDGSLALLRGEDGSLAREVKPGGGAVTCVASSTDSPTLAVVGSLNGTARLVDSQTLETKQTLEGHGRPITSVAIAPGQQAPRGVATMRAWWLSVPSPLKRQPCTMPSPSNQCS